MIGHRTTTELPAQLRCRHAGGVHVSSPLPRMLSVSLGCAKELTPTLWVHCQPRSVPVGAQPPRRRTIGLCADPLPANVHSDAAAPGRADPPECEHTSSGGSAEG
jgi:hypothetical protein